MSHNDTYITTYLLLDTEWPMIQGTGVYFQEQNIQWVILYDIYNTHCLSH